MSWRPRRGRRRPSEERLNVFPCPMRGDISLMATEGKAGPHSRRRADEVPLEPEATDEVPPAPEARAEELKSIVPAFTRLSYKGHPQCLGKRKRSRLLTFFHSKIISDLTHN